MYQLSRNSIVYIFTAILFSCNAPKDRYMQFNCFGNAFVFFTDFKNVADSLAERNKSLEYNDSFSGEEEGVKMYSYQEKRDSIVVLNKLYFESGKLKAVSIDFTSSDIQNQTTFLKKIRDSVLSCISIKSDVYNVDTSSNNVNSLESASGKIFHLKVYDKLLHKKIPFVF